MLEGGDELGAELGARDDDGKVEMDLDAWIGLRELEERAVDDGRVLGKELVLAARLEGADVGPAGRVGKPGAAVSAEATIRRTR